VTVSIDEPIQVGANAWELRWSSDQSDPQYRIYRNGVLVAQTRRQSCVLTMPEAEAHTIEILDVATDVARKPGRPWVRIGWNPDANATHYLIEQFIGGQWELIATVQETGKQRWHAYIAALGDDATHQFRVTTVSRSGAGTPATLTYLLVRAPDPPYVNTVYDGVTGNVVVAAA
jgi:hypothetical protein